MRVTRRRLLAASTTTVALSTTGCLTGDDTGAGETDATTTESDGMTTEPATTTEDTGGSDDGDGSGVTVQVRSHPDHGDILVDGDGMTLYMFDQDTKGAGSSVCTGNCASNWPPLTTSDGVTAGDGVTADISTFDREDGSTQVAAGGWPLYAYAGDSEPDDATGQGAGDVWWVLRPDGTPVKPDGGDDGGAAGAMVEVRSHSEHGDILVDSEGMTLYMFDNDTEGDGSSSCQDSCAENWPPLTTDGEPGAGDGVTADLSTFERADGSTQVAAGGWPLYYYAGDSDPGDATGHGAGDVWWVLAPDGTPVKPDDGGGTTTDDGGGGGGGGYGRRSNATHRRR